MSISAALAGQINIETGGGAGAKPPTAEEEKRAKLLLTAEETPCPGGCGGMAWLEHSITTAVRGGETRYYRMATCHHTCRMDVRGGSIQTTNPSRTRPARFEVAVDAPDVPRPELAHPAPEAPVATMEERKAVQAAMLARGLNVYQLASDLRCDYTKLRRWLDKGKGLPPLVLTRLEQWLATEPRPRPVTTSPSPPLEKATMKHGNKKTGRDEEARERVKAALAAVAWPQVQLAEHIEASKSGFSQWLKRGMGIAKSKVAAALAWAAAVERGEIEPVTTTRQERAAQTMKARKSQGEVVVTQAPVKIDLTPELVAAARQMLADTSSEPEPRAAFELDVQPFIPSPVEFRPINPAELSTPQPSPASPWEAALRPVLEQGAQGVLSEVVGPEVSARFRVRVILEARDA